MFSKAGRNFTSLSATEPQGKRIFTAEYSVLIRAKYHRADMPYNEEVSPHSLYPCEIPILLLFHFSFMGVVVVIIHSDFIILSRS